MSCVLLRIKHLMACLHPAPGTCIRCHDPILFSFEKLLIESGDEVPYCDECAAVRCLERKANEAAMKEMFGYTYD
jgi:hypothetical protein